MAPTSDFASFCAQRSLAQPPSLHAALDDGLIGSLTDGGCRVLLRSDVSEHDDLGDALEVLAQGAYEPPPNLLPLLVVDEGSIACVVCEDQADATGWNPVVRWFVDPVPSTEQGALLDIDPLLYVSSLAEELDARPEGLTRMLDQIGPAYKRSHLMDNRRPRDYVVRPVRIACQNVIVGLAAIAQDSSFDGLSVVAWQTCEVPHVATHEANRALAALTLCDAFRNGGTMEIRFDRPARVVDGDKRWTYEGHPEMRVPASLRRFGRTLGVALGMEDPGAISPAEARELFIAIAPMPPDLRSRFEELVETRGVPPERVCFSLLAQVWREIELDLILATTSRAPSILEGGADWTDRPARQAESEVCRAAVMLGMLFRRLDSTDAAGDDGVARVIEDRKRGIEWAVDAERGGVWLTGLDPDEELPWTRGRQGATSLFVLPRTMPTDQVLTMVAEMEMEIGSNDATAVALLLPADVPAPSSVGDLLVLRCPDRAADIDKAIEAKLLASRISR